MSQESAHHDGAHGDTSDRLYTAEDLERFAQQQLEQARQPVPAQVQGDPLTDPIKAMTILARQNVVDSKPITAPCPSAPKRSAHQPGTMAL